MTHTRQPQGAQVPQAQNNNGLITQRSPCVCAWVWKACDGTQLNVANAHMPCAQRMRSELPDKIHVDLPCLGHQHPVRVSVYRKSSSI